MADAAAVIWPSLNRKKLGLLLAGATALVLATAHVLYFDPIIAGEAALRAGITVNSAPPMDRGRRFRPECYANGYNVCGTSYFEYNADERRIYDRAKDKYLWGERTGLLVLYITGVLAAYLIGRFALGVAQTIRQRGRAFGAWLSQ